MVKGDATPLHIHRTEDEVFYLLAGQMLFEVDGVQIRAQAGDVVMAPKGVPHRFVVDVSEGAHCLTIMRGSDFETVVREVSTPAVTRLVVPAPAPTAEAVQRLVSTLAAHSIDVLGPPLAA